jgi:hypothetical protein
MAPTIGGADVASRRSVHAGGVGLLVGVVAAAHHGAHGGVAEAHLVGFGLEHLEGVGVHVAAHGQVAVAGGQVLADGQHVDVVRAHVAHHLQDLFVGLAQAHHDAALGGHVGVQGLELLQQVQAELVVGARARFLVQARRGFQVVVHHIGRRGLQDFQRAVVAAAEVGHQDLDLRLGESRGCSGCTPQNGRCRRRAGRRGPRW